MNTSISQRLILWLAVPLTLVALCGALVHYFNNVAPSIISSDQRLKAATNALMAHLSTKDGQITLEARPSEPQRLPSADSATFVIRDIQGGLLYGDPRIPIVSMNREISQLITMIQIEHRNIRSLTTRFDMPGAIVLITVADIRPTSEPVARYSFMSTLLWDFVQLDITLVLVWVGIQLGLRPIKRLRDEIAARSPQDLRKIDDTAVPREIAPVVITLNRLFTTLRSSVQSQQEFISNTAHQLRTPITGMQAQLELLIAEEAAQPVKHRLLILQESIRQLTHSANQLLTLARADSAANIAPKKQTVDIKAMVGEVAARFFDRALKEHIDLGVEVKPAAVQADPALLDDLLSNLVDNALKYTPAGGSVTVSAGRHDGKPYLAVEDTGPGIPAAERHLVRQRFYRIANSPGHGSGLGLAIVDEIAGLHDATVTIGSGADNRGTKVWVEFP